MNHTYLQQTTFDEDSGMKVPCLLGRKLSNLDKVIFFKLKYPIILLLICLYLPANSQDFEKKEIKNYVGVNAGFTSGFGFTYGYWPGKLGFMLTFLPVKTVETTLISLSITPYYTLNQSMYFKSYLFLGNSLVTNSIDTEYNIGFGPGFEAGSKVVFSLRGGFGFYDITDTFSILPTLDMGVYFKF